MSKVAFGCRRLLSRSEYSEMIGNARRSDPIDPDADLRFAGIGERGEVAAAGLDD
jgi:hypothetical protein